VIELQIIFPHLKGSTRINAEFVVMKNTNVDYFILGNYFLVLYGFDIVNSKYRYFTIGNSNKNKKFSFIPSKIPPAVMHQASEPIQSLDRVDLDRFIQEDVSEAKVNTELNNQQKIELLEMLYTNREAFATVDEPFGSIIGHEVEIKLTVERPYPPLLRRPAYPASPKSREALERHINELLKLGVLRKVGHNEIVEITTPVIIAWHNGKSRMVGDFRALNTYTSADRYPIPRIHETLRNLANAQFISSMDVLKGFHQNVVEEASRKFLRIILHNTTNICNFT
jgi:hypothetical protein